VRGERFAARVTDDTHRDTAGALVPDGCVELVAPGYGGEHKLKWVPPVTRGVHVVPIVGTTVRLLVDDGQLHWEPMDGDEGLPAWMQTGYPARSGMQSRSGSLQVAFDEEADAVCLADADATDEIALHPGLKAYINNVARAFVLAHTHLYTSPTGPLETAPPSAVIPPGAEWTLMADEGKSAKVKAV